jgi:hypothetical protein
VPWQALQPPSRRARLGVSLPQQKNHLFLCRDRKWEMVFLLDILMALRTRLPLPSLMSAILIMLIYLMVMPLGQGLLGNHVQRVRFSRWSVLGKGDH